jgi:hypothetical protein
MAKYAQALRKEMCSSRILFDDKTTERLEVTMASRGEQGSSKKL